MPPRSSVGTDFIHLYFPLYITVSRYTTVILISVINKVNIINVINKELVSIITYNSFASEL